MYMESISIIINTRDRISRLRIVLKALECQVDDRTEVIVVFDGCMKKTMEEFDSLNLSFKPIKIVNSKNMGQAYARNRGIERATGHILIFLDDDRIPAPDFVKMHVSRHSERCVVLGNRMDVNFNEEELEQLYLSDAITNDFQNSIVSRAYRAFDSHDTALRKFLFRYPKNPVLWVMFYTGNVSVRREDMVKIGMFDEKFFGWGIEDLEIGYRFQKEGIKIIRGSNITNYHLTHDYDPVQRMREASRNINYFLRKSRRDFLVKAILYMLKFTILLRILHRNLLKKNSKEGIRYARKA